MRASTLVPLLLALTALPGLADAADRACEQSERTVTSSPKGRWETSVQHQVCETEAGGAAAAVTVYVGEAGAALQGGRVVATAVPRSRDEWPRAVWRGESLLEIWVPNFAQVLETRPAYRDVTVVLKHCADDPDARARVAQHQVQMQQWMQAVSNWAELRKRDPDAAGARPPRPEEPRVASRPCRDGDIPPWAVNGYEQFVTVCRRENWCAATRDWKDCMYYPPLRGTYFKVGADGKVHDWAMGFIAPYNSNSGWKDWS